MSRDKLTDLPPLNDSWLSGRPFYCALCGAGYGEFIACEMPDCTLETAQVAQARLAKARSQSTPDILRSDD